MADEPFIGTAFFCDQRKTQDQIGSNSLGSVRKGGNKFGESLLCIFKDRLTVSDQQDIKVKTQEVTNAFPKSFGIIHHAFTEETAASRWIPNDGVARDEDLSFRPVKGDFARGLSGHAQNAQRPDFFTDRDLPVDLCALCSRVRRIRGMNEGGRAGFSPDAIRRP